MSRTAPQTDRALDLDLLRIIACFFVVMIHVAAEPWMTLSPSTLGWQSVNFLNTVAHCAVPLYVMISGALFLKRERSMRTILRKNVLRLVVLFVLWSLFYAVDTVGVSALGTLSGLKSVVYEFLTVKYHLWYLQSIAAAYLLLPLLWGLVRYRDGKYVPYICLVFLASAVASVLLVLLPIPKEITAAMSHFLPQLAYFPAMMLLGYLLYTAEPRSFETPLRVLLVCVAFLCLTALGGTLLSLAEDAPNDRLLRNSSPTAIVCAGLLFRAVRLMRLPKFFRRHHDLIRRLSACTLGIYLLHVFVMEHLCGWLGFDVKAYPLALSVPLFSLAVFLISLGVTALLRRIPFVGKRIV